MDHPMCKLCGTRHPLGQHTAFESSRGGGEAKAKERPVGDVASGPRPKRDDVEPGKVRTGEATGARREKLTSIEADRKAEEDVIAFMTEYGSGIDFGQRGSKRRLREACGRLIVKGVLKGSVRAAFFADKTTTTETKTNAKSNGVSMGKSRVNLPPPPPRKSGRPKKLKKLPKAKLGRPFASEKHLTLTALKPWEDVINKDGSKGISRAEFYRRKKKARQQKRAFQI